MFPVALSVEIEKNAYNVNVILWFFADTSSLHTTTKLVSTMCASVHIILYSSIIYFLFFFSLGVQVSSSILTTIISLHSNKYRINNHKTRDRDLSSEARTKKKLKYSVDNLTGLQSGATSRDSILDVERAHVS